MQSDEPIVSEEVKVVEELKQVKQKLEPCRWTFDISEASSAKLLMEEVLKDSNGKWRSAPREKADVRYVWCNADDADLIKVMKAKNRLISRYPGIKGLSHKDQFTRYMKICLKNKPEAYSFVPPQFEFPKERDALAAYMKNHKNACFIGKPQGGS